MYLGALAEAEAFIHKFDSGFNMDSSPTPLKAELTNKLLDTTGSGQDKPYSGANDVSTDQEPATDLDETASGKKSAKRRKRKAAETGTGDRKRAKLEGSESVTATKTSKKVDLQPVRKKLCMPDPLTSSVAVERITKVASPYAQNVGGEVSEVATLPSSCKEEESCVDKIASLPSPNSTEEKRASTPVNGEESAKMENMQEMAISGESVNSQLQSISPSVSTSSSPPREPSRHSYLYSLSDSSSSDIDLHYDSSGDDLPVVNFTFKESLTVDELKPMDVIWLKHNTDPHWPALVSTQYHTLIGQLTDWPK